MGSFDEYISGGNYLKHEHLQGREFRLVVSEFQWEDMTDQRSGRSESKPVLYFHGAERGLVLNKTNGRILADAFGLPPERTFIGQTVVLYVIPETGMGPGIGVRVESGSVSTEHLHHTQQQPPPQQEPPAQRSFQDDPEIPF